MATGYRKLFLPFLFLIAPFISFAQVCPANIGVEDGSFTNWKCFYGSIDTKGVIKLTYTQDPLADIHTIWKKTSPQVMDPYGGFPVNCPNGSNYSIQLGNDSHGATAQSISYTYTIPADKPSFSLIYYYAVVLQIDNHILGTQPAFQTAIKDITSPEVLATLPNTEQSDIFCINNRLAPITSSPDYTHAPSRHDMPDDVYYKDWSPVIINLDGYAGHTIEISFTANNCANSDHICYAYIDFNEACDPAYDGLITGNKVCAGAQSVTLTSPPGFLGYRWYDEASNLLSSKPSLTLKPIPAEGTKYKLTVTPYPGQGCPATVYTEIKNSAESFNLQVQSNITNCRVNGVDLTQDSIKTGSSPGLNYEYYLDPDGHNVVPNPKLITTDGIYYQGQ